MGATAGSSLTEEERVHRRILLLYGLPLEDTSLMQEDTVTPPHSSVASLFSPAYSVRLQSEGLCLRCGPRDYVCGALSPEMARLLETYPDILSKKSYFEHWGAGSDRNCDFKDGLQDAA